MTYDADSHEIVLTFRNIRDLMNVNGTHPLRISLHDEKDRKIYQVNLEFMIPSRKIKPIEVVEKPKQRSPTVNATIT